MSVIAAAVASEVSTRVASSSGLKLGSNAATALDLMPIGAASAFALAVGVHRDLPNVVIKVMDTSQDMCAAFLQAVFEGVLTGPHMPHVLSITPAGENTIVVLMERLFPLLEGTNKDAYGYLNSSAEVIGYHDLGIARKVAVLQDAFRRGWGGTQDVHALCDWADHHGFEKDLHTGNIMQRANGQLVIIDPVA